MRFIGLTGGIATGKTTVAALLRGHGAVVVDADELARTVVEPGSAALEEIVAAFGPDILDASGRLDRVAMGRIIFADPARRATLEAITHPRISTLMAERVAAALAGPAPLVVADVPLLFENRRQDLFEGTMLVHVPPEVQLSRLVARDGIDAAAARQRLAAQMPIDDKRDLATWVIDNSATPAITAAQVDAWWATEVSGAHAVDEQ